MVIGICDDVKDAREQIRRLCRDIFSREARECLFVMFADGKEVLKASKHIDLLFLDIEMQSLDGISVKNYLCENERDTMIIYVSSHSEMFRETYGRNVYGFLQKNENGKVDENETELLVHQFLQAKREPKLIHTDMGYFRSDCVEYIKAEDVYVSLHQYNDTTSTIIRKTIREMEEELDDFDFARIHRSFLINMNYVENADATNKVVLQGQSLVLPIGRKYKIDWQEKYNLFCKRKARYC